jgi:hypothetical protein
MSDLFINNRRIFSCVSDRLRLYNGNAEVTLGIDAVPTPGQSIAKYDLR